ncbi:MAG: hypothetical protein ACI4XM_00435 [Candidatus Coprovivens sp.]
MLGESEKQIDSRTKFVVGSEEYNNYYFPIIDNSDDKLIYEKKDRITLEDTAIDPKTGFVIGSEEYNNYYSSEVEDLGRHR